MRRHYILPYIWGAIFFSGCGVHLPEGLLTSAVCTSCSLTISSDRPLVVTSTSVTVPFAPIGGGSAPAVAGATPVGGATYSGSGTVASGVSTLNTGGLTAVAKTSTDYDTSGSFSVAVTVDNSYPAASCSVRPPFQAVSCNTSNFTVGSLSISQSGEFSISLTETTTNSTINSNVLAATYLEIKQVSNTRASQSFGDALGISFVESSNGYLYFHADNSSGGEKLFRTNGSVVETVSNTRNVGAGDDDITSMKALSDGRIFFKARNSTNNVHKFYLVGHDGITVTQVSDTRSNQNQADNGFWPHITAWGNAAYFIARNATGDYKIYKYDGDTDTLSQFSNTRGNNSDDDTPEAIALHNGALYFDSLNTNVRDKIFKSTDGSTITQLSNIQGDNNNHDVIDSFRSQGDYLWFRAANPAAGGRKLFRTDGTTITEIRTTSASGASDDIPSLRVEQVGNKYYAPMNNSNGVLKLYEIDGTTVTQISNTVGNNAASDAITSIDAVGDNIYFIANNFSGNQKLYLYDGSTVKQLSDTREHPLLSDDISELTPYNGKLYFIADDSTGDAKLFMTDGENVFQISNINDGENDFDNDGTCSSSANIPGVYLNRLWFVAVVDGDDRCDDKLFSLCDTSLSCN